MADAPSFMESVGLVFGAIAFLMWVVSDVLEEQLIGKPRRERQRAVKARARLETRRRAHLPRAEVHRLPNA